MSRAVEPSETFCGKEGQWSERALIFAKKKRSKRYKTCPEVVPEAGVEPARYRYHWILSPARLPIPSFRQMLPTYYTVTNIKNQVLFLTF